MPGGQTRDMRILVTNDDGIESPGLHVLARALCAVGEVRVFAPSAEYSGAGAAIGHLSAGLPDVHHVERHEMPDAVAVYHLDGPPALASLLACRGMLGELPDVVVSGINPGWNVGHAVHFSGTIGACITANVFGIPSVAVSQHTTDGPMNWETAAQAAVDQLPRAIEHGLLLNVNVPNVPLDQIQGVRDTILSDRIPYSLHSPTLTEIEPGRFTAAFERFTDFDGPEGTDTHAVEAGFISVTPLTSTGATP